MEEEIRQVTDTTWLLALEDDRTYTAITLKLTVDGKFFYEAVAQLPLDGNPHYAGIGIELGLNYHESPETDDTY